MLTLCHRRSRLFAAVLLMPWATMVHAADWSWPGWQDDYETHQKAWKQLQALNTTLLTQSSATKTLQQWCAAHNMAQEARIRAVRDISVNKPASSEIRALLQVGQDEQLGYRRVKLSCGDKVLSEADNWYVKSLLTSTMNHTLDTSDTPFGTAVSALNFTRQTQSVSFLWSPVVVTKPTHGPTLPEIPVYVLQHQAVLYRQDSKPFSLVKETYRRDIFAFKHAPN